MTILDRLAAAADPAYKAFQQRLVPTVPPERILGVRTPALRGIAKEVKAGGERDAFLASLPHAFYEEDLVHFFVIAAIRDFGECVREVDRFLPYVDCWPVSDQASPKCFGKNRQELLPHIQRWIASEHVYTARFGIRMLMNEFLGEDFREEYLQWAVSGPGDDYYLKMMQAWFLATALAKQYPAALRAIREGKMDEWVRRKAIQKALESFRVTDEHKNTLRALR